jgi:predicted enzyme related to lactoylglutathione lyase
MPNPVVHFEIIGRDPELLRAFYAELFGWEYHLPSPVAAEVSEASSYGFIAPGPDAAAGGIGGGAEFEPHTVFYVGVANVEEALRAAERLGGRRVMGPAHKPGGGLVVAHFTDPEGNLVGLAGPA